MTKFFNKFLKPQIWPIFPICALSCTTSSGFLKPCQNLEKTNDPIPRKRLERRTVKRKDGQTLFCRVLQTNVGVQINGYKVSHKEFKTVVTRITLTIMLPSS